MRVGRIHLSGNLSYENEAFLLLESLVETQDENRPDVLVFWINSTGGSLCVAQEMVSMLRQLNCLTVVSVGEICASSAYYLALVADHIVVHPASLMGGFCSSLSVSPSSGAVSNSSDASLTHVNGPLKGMLSRPGDSVTVNERDAIRDILNDLDSNFHGFIRSRRSLQVNAEKVFDGRLISGIRAKELGFADDLGGMVDALAWIRKRFNVEEFELVTLSLESREEHPF